MKTLLVLGVLVLVVWGLVLARPDDSRFDTPRQPTPTGGTTQCGLSHDRCDAP